MFQSSSDTTATSPIPISPFSSYSANSEATSDEAPDLGAFTSVFRALDQLQPSRSLFFSSLPTQTDTEQASSTVGPTSSSALLSTLNLEDSDNQRVGSTVWSQRPIASYLKSISSRDQETETLAEDFPSSDYVDTDGGSGGSDTEGEHQSTHKEQQEEFDVSSSDVETSLHPSLGYLDNVLSFLAEERARYNAKKEAGASEGAIKQAETRRKRRRKRPHTASSGTPHHESSSGKSTSAGARRMQLSVYTPSRGAETEADVDEYEGDSSSSFEPSGRNPYKSTPATPPQKNIELQKEQIDIVSRNSRLAHSKSTPSFRNLVNGPPDARVISLRKLAHKLRLLFPADAPSLSNILSGPQLDGDDGFIDPRGPEPRNDDTLIHIFIDHSNILIGFLTYLKRHSHHSSRKTRHMSHAALALILERGRPITRRVLVTSSPLYQPMDSAEQLGYEVRVYARVPDLGDGADRRGNHDSPGHRRTNSAEAASRDGTLRPFKKGRGHGKRGSVGGNTSTESEHAQGMSFLDLSSPRARSTTRSSLASSSTGSPSTHRVRYREQGVDELLQLKLHQAIADVNVPPPNATIVLATGDGNVGQFNEDGFLGPVRTALKKGWRVELYAWKDGLSRAWMREFGDSPWKDRFRVISLEDFGMDLLEI